LKLLCGLCYCNVSLSKVTRYGNLGVIIVYQCPQCKREYEDIGIFKERDSMEIIQISKEIDISN
jgi:hypothetical protein